MLLADLLTVYMLERFYSERRLDKNSKFFDSLPADPINVGLKMH